jgi:hypothetical protein
MGMNLGEANNPVALWQLFRFKELQARTQEQREIKEQWGSRFTTLFGG